MLDSKRMPTLFIYIEYDWQNINTQLFAPTLFGKMNFVLLIQSNN